MYNDNDESANGTLKEIEGYSELIENMTQALDTSDYDDIVLAMVHKNPMVFLAYVNHDWVLKNSDKYKEVVQVAVKQNPMALEDVNTAWVEGNWRCYYEIVKKLLDEVFKNNGNYYEIALAAVKKDGYVLHYVNEDWAVENSIGYYDIVLEAVKQNGLALRLALRYVNYYLFKNSDKYKEVVQVAVKQNPMALEQIHITWIKDNPQQYNEIVKNLLDEVFKNNGNYYEIALAAVNQNGNALEYVNHDWVSKNSDKYKKIALAAVKGNGYTLKYVNEECVAESYYEIALAAVNQNGLALRYVNYYWIFKNSDEYNEVAQKAVNQNGLAFEYVNKDWASKNSDQYKEIALEAVKKDAYALLYVRYNWALENSDQYKEIVLKAVKKDPYVLLYVRNHWVVKNSELYKEIVLAAVNQSGLAFKYVTGVLRNNIKIAILSLMNLDCEYSKKYSSVDCYILIKETLTFAISTPFVISTPCELIQNILLYLDILSNQNISNKFKHALFNLFRDKFDATEPYKSLYKNILEFYLILSEGYTESFSEYTLLKGLTDDDYKALYTFLSLADPSALENAKLPKFLKENKNKHNAIINNYLSNNKDAIKCIKNLTMYKCMVPKNLFFSGMLLNNLVVVDYSNIINMKCSILKKIMPSDIIVSVLRYLPINNLLKWDEILDLYLDMCLLGYHRSSGFTSTGIEAIEAFVNAKISIKGDLSLNLNFHGVKHKYGIYKLFNVSSGILKKIK